METVRFLFARLRGLRGGNGKDVLRKGLESQPRKEVYDCLPPKSE
jgi:hypothetical protein